MAEIAFQSEILLCQILLLDLAVSQSVSHGHRELPRIWQPVTEVIIYRPNHRASFVQMDWHTGESLVLI